VATKLSNFHPSTQSREASIGMYQNSLKQLQVDYIDYYLLHAIGGGMDEFNRRYVDNGMMDYLMKEREAGRIRNLGFSFHGYKEVFDEVLAMHDKYHWDFVQIELNYLDWTMPMRLMSAT
jgi:predicted aldo/keto reductase-like oxidoreductase